MNIKKFRLVSKATSFILKVFAIFGIIGLAISLFFGFSKNPNFSFQLNISNSSFLLFQSGPMLGNEVTLASLIAAPPFVLALCYTFWQGASLFDRLNDGELPFSQDFANSVRKISLLLIALDVLLPLVYSLVLSIIIENGYYFTFGLTSLFLIGLILYIVSEILSYGIELQKLADDTV